MLKHLVGLLIVTTVYINGGFEDTPSGWTLIGGGCEIATVNPRGGVNALRMFTEGDPDLDISGAATAFRSVSVTPGTEYTVSLWVSGRDYVAGGGTIDVLIDSLELGTVGLSPGTGYQQIHVGMFVPSSSPVTLQLFSVSTFTASTVWVDDVVLTEHSAMAILKNIRTALVDTDLAGISGATVSEDLLKGPLTGDKHIVLTPQEGGAAAPGTGAQETPNEITALQNYTLKALRVGSRDDADDFMDDIRNAVENGSVLTDTGNTLGTITVRVDPFSINDSGDGQYHIEATVAVVYHYTRGSA